MSHESSAPPAEGSGVGQPWADRRRIVVVYDDDEDDEGVISEQDYESPHMFTEAPCNGIARLVLTRVSASRDGQALHA